jgi:hypothetical protein
MFLEIGPLPLAGKPVRRCVIINGGAWTARLPRIINRSYPRFPSLARQKRLVFPG